ncbi:MAG: LysR family transcriptional regulator [Deltaproteobacteria bacterium]|nr:LysR family transcriptional regulator [Deltaproteobacteria bacterium]
MDIHQLKTFVAVAHERSITRASEVLHLSQPAVSAHIKAIEDALGLVLFERTPRGMSLTPHGERLLAKAEGALAAHRELMGEATRIKGHLTGKLRLGAGGGSITSLAGRLVARLAERWPEVAVTLEHAPSLEVAAAIRAGKLDAGLFNETGEPDPDLETLEASRFTISVVARPGLVAATAEPDWPALAELAWIYPTVSACCGRTAEDLFRRHRIRPKRIINVDREEVTRSLVMSGVGVGLLHEDTIRAAGDELVPIALAPTPVRVLFGYLASRSNDPLIIAAAAIVRELTTE